MKRIFFVVNFLIFSYLCGWTQVGCASYDYQQEQLKRNPDLARIMQQIEALSSDLTRRPEQLSGADGPGTGFSVIQIPVVVHIIYRDADQNISDQQVYSQIEALNRAFRHRNDDSILTPNIFKPLTADCYIEFALAHIDPDGYETNGIVRRKTNILNFSIDDRIKYSSQGGDDAWDADRYLNIWVGNTAAGVIGYSSLVGGPKDKDGIVIRYSAFGTTGKASAPYNMGRSAVHEVGHWLGLRHIWGDSYCGNDNIDDTPPQRSATTGCPSGTIISCDNAPAGDMYMNYMDLTYDACTNMFTVGQRDKMRSLFADGAPRHALLSSNGVNGIPLPGPPPDNRANGESARLFPNPAHNLAQVRLSEEEVLQGTIIRVFNQFGQPLLTIKAINPITGIPLDRYPDGIYYIQVGNDKKPQKLLKSAATFNF